MPVLISIYHECLMLLAFSFPQMFQFIDFDTEEESIRLFMFRAGSRGIQVVRWRRDVIIRFISGSIVDEINTKTQYYLDSF